jgi:hypothetical protein
MGSGKWDFAFLFLSDLTFFSFFYQSTIFDSYTFLFLNLIIFSDSRTLTSHMMDMQSKLAIVSNHGTAAEKEQVELSLSSIERTIRTTEMNNQLKPFRVFGMVAQSGLTVSVLTTAVSFYSVVFSMYSTTGSGDPDISQYAQ